MKRRALLFFGAFAIAAFGVSQWHSASALIAVPSGPLDRLAIGRYTLDNGLRVVLNPDESATTIAIAVYYDVGSRNEVEGRSGFAHLFEHMMFQGSANIGKGEHFIYVRNRGGSANGTTSADRTNYYETLPSNELALGLWLESDRMRSLEVTAENFENQREVVKEERRQSYEDRPYSLSFLEANALAYGDYWPYAHSTIGDMADLDAAELEDVQAFFNTYYRPNNAVLSISGNFDVDEARQLIERYFGDIPSGEIPEYAPVGEVPSGPRERTMRDPLAERAAFHLMYNIPPERHEDHAALEVLTLILGDGNSSRLYQSLVRERELCTEISVSTDDRRGPDLFNVFAVMAGDSEVADATTLVQNTIGDIAQNGVSTAELEEAHNAIRSYFVYGLESSLGRAQRLAEYEMYTGDAENIRGELRRYLRVSAEDVQRVAAEYFGEDRRSLLIVEAGSGSQPDASETGGEAQ